MSAALTLDGLVPLSVWEAENRYGLLTYGGPNGLSHAAVCIQVASPNFILCLPEAAVSADDLNAAELADFLDTDYGPNTTVEVRLRSSAPGARAMTRRGRVLLVEMKGSLVGRLSIYEEHISVVQFFGEGRAGSALWPFGRDLRVVTLEWLASVQTEQRLESYHTGESEVEEESRNQPLQDVLHSFSV
jgi:hypothetical protein